MFKFIYYNIVFIRLVRRDVINSNCLESNSAIAKEWNEINSKYDIIGIYDILIILYFYISIYKHFASIKIVYTITVNDYLYYKLFINSIYSVNYNGIILKQ